MRALKSFSLGFGMVNVPVSLYSATDDKRKSLPVHQFHTCGSRLKKPNYCPKCEAMVEAREIIKGYEITADEMLPITEADYAKLRLPSLTNINVEMFVPSKVLDADPRWYKDTYFLSTEEVGSRAFALFRDAMAEMNVIGLAKMTLREKESLVAVRPLTGVILLQTMHWADEIRNYDELMIFETVQPSEMNMAKQLISSMVVNEPDMSQFTDKWLVAFEEMIKAKYEKQEWEIPEVKEEPEADLASQLLASLASLSGEVTK